MRRVTLRNARYWRRCTPNVVVRRKGNARATNLNAESSKRVGHRGTRQRVQVDGRHWQSVNHIAASALFTGPKEGAHLRLPCLCHLPSGRLWPWPLLWPWPYRVGRVPHQHCFCQRGLAYEALFMGVRAILLLGTTTMISEVETDLSCPYPLPYPEAPARTDAQRPWLLLRRSPSPAF